jgi:hypothetical protein
MTDFSASPTYSAFQRNETGGPLDKHGFAFAGAAGNVAWATADLAGGALHIYGSTVTPTKADPDSWWGASSAVSSIAQFHDRVWFDVPNGQLGTIVPYEIRIEGTVSGSGQAGVTWDINGDSGEYYFGSGKTIEGTFAAGSWAQSFKINVGVAGGASAGSGEGAKPGTYDVAHTVKLRIFLPEGVTGHSASGVLPFYSATESMPSEVPEPSSVTLISAAGLVLLLGKAKRIRST